jgi:hypothetical protein
MTFLLSKKVDFDRALPLLGGHSSLRADGAATHLRGPDFESALTALALQCSNVANQLISLRLCQKRALMTYYWYWAGLANVVSEMSAKMRTTKQEREKMRKTG